MKEKLLILWFFCLYSLVRKHGLKQRNENEITKVDRVARSSLCHEFPPVGIHAYSNWIYYQNLSLFLNTCTPIHIVKCQSVKRQMPLTQQILLDDRSIFPMENSIQSSKTDFLEIAIQGIDTHFQAITFQIYLS